MLTASQIIERLGGANAIATALSLPPTTVYSWGAVNFIPTWRQPSLLALAATKEKALSTADFPTIEHRISRAQKAVA